MRCFSLIILLIIPRHVFAQFSQSDLTKASRYFAEAREAANKGNLLWAHNLYGPIIMVDPKTLEGIANENDSAQTFRGEAGIFTGKVPDNFGVANTAQNWQRKVWTIVRWPLPDNLHERQNLMMHELFHQLQKRINLNESDANCGHLDKFEGRLLLKLELEALRTVLVTYPKFKQKDLQAALAIRTARYQIFSDADSLERKLEQNEGLAEFTGISLSGRSDSEIKEKLISSIGEFYQNKSFVRSMAYITGPVYGFLLSHKNKSWNKIFLQADAISSKLSFQNIVAETYHLTIPRDGKNILGDIAKHGLYNYNTVYNYEKSREDTRLQTMKENKKKFIDGPTLILPNAKMNFVFNPNEVQMIDDYGPVYPTFSANADWGSLTVIKGGAFIKDWMYVYLPLPQNFTSETNSIDSGDWQPKLKEGWKIKEGKRKGDYEVVRSE